MRRSAFAVLLTLFASVAFSATFIVAPDDVLFQKADAVVVASVIGSHPELVAEGGLMTITDARIESVIKGPLQPGELFATEAPGGSLAGMSMELHGTPKYRPGSKVLLFLFEWQPGHWATVDLAVGKFDFRTDVRGREVLVREESQIIGWDQDLAPFTERRRLAGPFLDYLRGLQAGRANEVSYFVESDALVPEPLADATIFGTAGKVVSNAIVPPSTNYLLEQGGNNFRWTAFPGQVPFRSYNAGSAVPGSDSAIAAGVTAWNADCGSNINLSYAGGTLKSPPTGLNGGGGTMADGENSIRWEVDLSGVNDFSCSGGGFSGVLGLGGPTGIGSGHTFDGMSYFSITEGDVDMNRGLAACGGLPQSVKDAAIAHEVGHTLNFRHSDRTRSDASTCAAPLPCSDFAVMKASLPSGLGATLQSWDIDAARAVYPGGNCGKLRGDFDNDSRGDILWRELATGQNVVWRMNGFSILQAAYIAPASTSFTLAGIADFDGNGTTDFLWRENGSGQNVMWLMNGLSIQSAAYIAPASTSFSLAGVGDFDADGKSDILWRENETGQNVMWLMNGMSIKSAAYIARSGTSFTPVAVADFDGNGTADILWRENASGQNVMWQMNGMSITGASYIASASTSFSLAGAADFDGDGDADILWRELATGQNVMWLMTGFGIQSAAYIAPANISFNQSGVADFNGDGKADILWRESATGQNVVWQMNGMSISNAAYIAPSGTTFSLASPQK